MKTVENDVEKPILKEKKVVNVLNPLWEISLECNVPLNKVIGVYQNYLPKGEEFGYNASALDKCRSCYRFDK